MKKKIFKKKLNLHKHVVSKLNLNEASKVKGGYTGGGGGGGGGDTENFLPPCYPEGDETMDAACYCNASGTCPSWLCTISCFCW